MKEYGWPITDVTVSPNEDACRLAETILSRANNKWLNHYVNKLEQVHNDMRKQKPVPFSIMHTRLMLDKAKELLNKRNRAANGLAGG